mmetsp:Transcript_6273/g.16029  ORF Transcript_6273/g.16029 Transcript_6273/m.16029 type:complete len:272 (-) Transcript_6273:137-952(-)
MSTSCCRASSWIWSLLLNCSWRSLSCSCLILIFCSIESWCLLRRRESSSLSSSIVLRLADCSLSVLSTARMPACATWSSAERALSDDSLTSTCFLTLPGSPRTFIMRCRSSSTSICSCAISCASFVAFCSSSSFSTRLFWLWSVADAISACSCSMWRLSASMRGRRASMASRSFSSFSLVISSFCRSSSAISSISIASLSSHSTTSASALANSVRVCSSSSLTSLSRPPMSSAASFSLRKSSLRSFALRSKFFSFSYVWSTTSCSLAYLLL